MPQYTTRSLFITLISPRYPWKVPAKAAINILKVIRVGKNFLRLDPVPREKCKVKYGAVADCFVSCWSHQCINSWRSLFREDVSKLIFCTAELHLSSAMGASSKYPAFGHKMFSPLSGTCHAASSLYEIHSVIHQAVQQYIVVETVKLLKAGCEYCIFICCIFHSSSSFMEN